MVGSVSIGGPGSPRRRRRAAKEVEPLPAVAGLSLDGASLPAVAGRRDAAMLGQDSAIALRVKRLAAAGQLDEARDAFAGIVTLHQRRASRIAYHVLRDPADADEAVQEAFVKVFLHIASYREDAPFEVWFTRILVNGCLDRQKARRRRDRWIVSPPGTANNERSVLEQASGSGPSPEERLLADERRRRIAVAVDTLPDRQRTVLLLCLYEERSAQEVSAMTGMNQSTVRVHLFRAVRKLRALLENERDSRR
jgi:RNA polymerase sigma-70 factor (ECF subfamily)